MWGCGKYFYHNVLEDQEYCLKKMEYNDLKTYKYERDKEVRRRRRVEKVKLKLNIMLISNFSLRPPYPPTLL